MLVISGAGNIYLTGSPVGRFFGVAVLGYMRSQVGRLDR